LYYARALPTNGKSRAAASPGFGLKPKAAGKAEAKAATAAAAKPAAKAGPHKHSAKQKPAAKAPQFNNAFTGYPMQAKIEDIEADFALLDNWEDRYRYIIELGGTLPAFPAGARDPAHKVRGCVSQVWLLCETSGDPKDPVLFFRGDSDAHIVKGLIAIVLALYSGQKASAVRQIDAVSHLARLGLEEHLTPQRSNGLRAMIGRIRAEAESRLP